MAWNGTLGTWATQNWPQGSEIKLNYARILYNNTQRRTNIGLSGIKTLANNQGQSVAVVIDRATPNSFTINKIEIYGQHGDIVENTPFATYTSDITITIENAEEFVYQVWCSFKLEGAANVSIELDTSALVTTDTMETYVDTNLSDYMKKGVDRVTAGKKSTTTLGTRATAEGFENTASGDYSHAEGYWTTSGGDHSHAEGYNTTASNTDAHAEGYETTASGLYSHSEGRNTVASNYQSHSEGKDTVSSGSSSHSEGNNTEASGDYSHAEGNGTTASGSSSHAEGGGTTASKAESHAEGYNTTASGSQSHAEGYNTTASGNRSHAEGYYSTAIGDYSHVEGSYNTANGLNSHVQGTYNQSNQDNVFIFGQYALDEGYTRAGLTLEVTSAATFSYDTNILYFNMAAAYSWVKFDVSYNLTGSGSITFTYNSGSGMTSSAGWKLYYTQDGQSISTEKITSSFTLTINDTTTKPITNMYIKASGSGSFSGVSSMFTSAGSGHNYLEIVGNGSDINNKSNARTLDFSGNETLAGTLTVGSDPTSNMEVATKHYVDNNGGGVFVATYQVTTFQEVVSAINSGKEVICIRTSGTNSYCYQLQLVSSVIIKFCYWDADFMNNLSLNSDDSWYTSQIRVQRKRIETSGTLVSSSWSSSSQTISVSNLNADDLVQVSPAPTSFDDYVDAGIRCTAQGAGTLTFECTNTPSNNVDVNIVIWK